MHENEIAFICFLLFFRNEPFQRVAGDSNAFFLLRMSPVAAPQQAGLIRRIGKPNTTFRFLASEKRQIETLVN